MTINDGGSAFPEVETTVHYVGENGDYTPISDTHSVGGASLRDYFAAESLTGLIQEIYAAGGCADGIFKPVASAAFQMADAMLAAREVQS